MLYTVYKTTNQVNGKFYIGVHTTEDPHDSYLGSGRALNRAVQKYGRSSFKKEILFVFDNPDDMYAKEREIVTKAFKRDPSNYNLIEGGTCPAKWIGYEGVIEASRKGTARLLELLKDDEFKSRHRDSLIRGVRERERKWSGAGQAWTGPKNFLGRTHSPVTLEKMRIARAGQSSGSKNSQFGTAWVCKLGEKPRKVKMRELEKWLSEGWERGRVS